MVQTKNHTADAPQRAWHTLPGNLQTESGNQRRFHLPVMAALLSTVLAGCSSLDMFGEPELLSKQGPVVVDKFTAESDDQDFTDPVVIGSAHELGAAVGIRDDHPEVYTVVRGDTLWDISGRFLTDPWEWPKVWKANPGIKNPHLIYPGDQIGLGYDENGFPILVVSRNGIKIGATSSGPGVDEKLSPQIREQSLKDAIPTIAGDAIRQFLTYPRVVSAREIDSAPYVIGNYEGRLTSAVGHEIYARGPINRNQPSYGVFRKNKVLRDPVTREVLGQEITHVANARLLQLGDPSTLLITSNKMETISGDRLMAANQGFTPHQYIPRTPQIEGGEGRIVSLVDAISQSGRNQVVVLNLGDQAGLKIGDVLAVERRGGNIPDRFNKRSNARVSIPNTRTGVVMVFQTFDRVSYALVMESTRPIHRNDVVTEI